MRRRTVLAATPTLLVGCLGVIDGGTSTTAHSTPTDTATATTHETTESTTSESSETETTNANTTEQPYELLPAEPASMTEDEVRTLLADHDCTELTDLQATCPDDDSQLHVSVSPRVGSLSSDVIECTIENQGDQPFKWGASDWLLQKWDGNRWRRIAPLSVPAVLNRIPAGESHTYRIHGVDSKPIDGQGAFIAEKDISIGGLGPGVYGFSTDGYFESRPDDEFAVAAMFGFAGEGQPIRPSDAVERVERDGSELTVHADASAEQRNRCSISFVDGDPDARLLPEHVHQLAPLLNTLPYATTEGIEEIHFAGSTDKIGGVDTYLSAVTPDGSSRFDFRNLVFEMSRMG